MTNLTIAGSRKKLYVGDSGIRLGSKGELQPAGTVLGGMSKGEARKVRKALRGGGFNGLAGSRRAA